MASVLEVAVDDPRPAHQQLAAGVSVPGQLGAVAVHDLHVHTEHRAALLGLHRPLRLDDLTEPIVRMLRASGERSITIAPETGSDRLRRVINKTVTNAEILDRAELIFSSGIESLKLYYMIGLPSEDDDDLLAIRDAGGLLPYARAKLKRQKATS